MTEAADAGASLVDRMRRGDDLAFAQLMEPHALPLRLFIRRLAGGVSGADCDEEDLFQLVVFRAWQLREGFIDEGAGSLRRWLVALARNVVGDRVRYLGAKGRRAARGQLDAASMASALPDSITSIASRAARGENADRLEAALNDLEPGIRELVQLYYIEGLSLAEVAERSGRARSSVWDELKVALGRLRDAIPG